MNITEIKTETLVRAGIPRPEAERLVIIFRASRKTFEHATCNRIGEQIGLRTAQDGTIIGIACQHYKHENQLYRQCEIRGRHRECTFAHMLER